MADPSLKEVLSRLERIEALIGRIPGGGFTDPGPDPFGGGFGGGFGGWVRPRWPIPFPQPGDPAPIDLSRFNHAQLSVAKEMIKTERFRLDAMEKLVEAQIKSADK